MPTDATSVEELDAFVDEQGHRYELRLFEDGSAWTIKAFDVQVLMAQVNCLVQGSDLFLADLHVFEAARHPLRRIDQIKGWLGFDVSGRIEDYQHRGLGTELLEFVVRRARQRRFGRITGKLFPKDLQVNPRLPEWYRHRGFQVAMDRAETAGELERVLSDYTAEIRPPD